MIDSIILGNSIEVLKTFPDEFVHAIISDIPYGIGYGEWDVLHNNTNSALGGSSAAQNKGGAVFKRRGKPLNGWSNADKKIPLEYQEWCTSWANEWLRVLKPGSSCFVFAGRRFAHRCIVALEDAGFTFKDMLAWKKNTAPHRAQRISEIYKRRGDIQQAENWQGWRVANLRPIFEPILWFQKPYKTGGTIADNVLQYSVGAWNENAISEYCIENYNDVAFSNVISVHYEKSDHGLHETQKPLKLMECLVALVTQEGAVVLDPFAGSGTNCLAASRLNRRYIGVEIDSDYVEIARKRINDDVIQLQLG
ncbi:MAG: site-specific DNA-methyltransferase [Oscillospiraceae bacterium]|nr:site-specific DNA-methyltransferase [Oscillospiraceae bacterium]